MCTTKIVFLSDSYIELGLKRSLQVQALRPSDDSDAIPQTNKYATVASCM